MEHHLFELPLKNPVLIFSLVLYIILFAPIILNRLKIPPIMGLIIAGTIIGPFGFHILKESSIELFGKVGLLYLMFLAGIEVDMAEFLKKRHKSIAFGLLIFIIPLSIGTVLSHLVLKYSILPSILIGSMFASYTIVAYPIVSRLGVNKEEVVTVTVGGVMITDTLTLLVLAVIAGMTKGNLDAIFWIRLIISIPIFALTVLFVLPVVARWFFKRYEDHISQFIFVLGFFFLSAFLAELAGLEPIIGAFLAGLALNRLIPHTSALMNRLEFVGNALFIPFFLIGVGMLVDIKVIFNSTAAVKVAIFMVATISISKFLAALITQKIFKYSSTERNMIFGLSSAHAGATLAAILVGYNIIIGKTPEGDPIRFLGEDILNGTILMILVMITISSFVVEKAARTMASKVSKDNFDSVKKTSDKILISVYNPDTIQSLIDMAVLIKPAKDKSPLFVLSVVDDRDSGSEKVTHAKKMLEIAAKYAAASDNEATTITRYDLNVTSGILHTIMEYGITDLVIGLHHKANFVDTFFGKKTEDLLRKTTQMIMIYKSIQPIGTIKRLIVAVPDKAEYETGFLKWLNKIVNLSKQSGTKPVFYSTTTTLKRIKSIVSKTSVASETSYHELHSWEDFLILTREVSKDDLIVIITARKTSISHNPFLERIPQKLSMYFKGNSFIILYPEQFDDKEHNHYMFSQLDAEFTDSVSDRMSQLEKLGNYIAKLFSKKNN